MGSPSGATVEGTKPKSKGEDHAGGEDFLEDENPAFVIEGVFIAGVFGSFDDDLEGAGFGVGIDGGGVGEVGNVAARHKKIGCG